MIKVLAIDDEQKNIAIIKRALGSRYEVNTATGGEEALEMAKEESFDLFLLDIMMPEVDGYEVCQRIKKEVSPKSKVILISGKTLIDDKIKGYELGADDYITKPFDPDELESKVSVYSKLIETEQELLRLNKSLEEEVERKTKEIIQKEKKVFLADHAVEVVHNLKNPLAVIYGYIALLEKRYPSEILLQKVAEGKKSLDEVIKNILEMNTSSKKGLKFCSLNDAITKEVEFFKIDRFFKNKISLSLELDNEIQNISVDPTIISQVLSNLVKNAIEAMHSSEKKEMKIKSKLNNEAFQVSVSDTGQGINKEDLDKIFQSKYTTKDGSEQSGGITGNGIGLSYVLKTMEFFGGDVKVSTNSGKGSTFTLIFPIKLMEKS